MKFNASFKTGIHRMLTVIRDSSPTRVAGFSLLHMYSAWKNQAFSDSTLHPNYLLRYILKRPRTPLNHFSLWPRVTGTAYGVCSAYGDRTPVSFHDWLWVKRTAPQPTEYRNKREIQAEVIRPSLVYSTDGIQGAKGNRVGARCVVVGD